MYGPGLFGSGMILASTGGRVMGVQSLRCNISEDDGVVGSGCWVAQRSLTRECLTYSGGISKIYTTLMIGSLLWLALSVI